jgi:hypothetical protein
MLRGAKLAGMGQLQQLKQLQLLCEQMCDEKNFCIIGEKS